MLKVCLAKPSRREVVSGSYLVAGHIDLNDYSGFIYQVVDGVVTAQVTLPFYV